MTASGQVLILDHDGSMQALAKQLKDSFEAETICVQTPQEALNTTSIAEIAVFIFDIDAPKYDWSPWLDRKPYALPTIMLYREGSKSGIKELLNYGAKNSFIRSAEDWDGIHDLVERCLNFSTLQVENELYRAKLEKANTSLKTSVQALQQDQQAGRQVQMRMLPQSPVQISDITFSREVIPSLYLSGDFIDYFTVGNNHAAFFMADVSGHGSSSAFVTVLLKNLFARKRSHFFHREDVSILNPVSMLEIANMELLDTNIGKHVTMCIGVIELSTGKMRYSVAGHLPLPVLVTENSIDYLQGKGSPVGMFAEASYTEQEISLPERFMLAVFSDGILEILPPEELIAKEQYLLQVFEQHHCEGDQKLLEHLGAKDIVDAPDDIAGLFISRGVLEDCK